MAIAILTARSMEKDTILEYDLGVDDYITKPFSPRVSFLDKTLIDIVKGKHHPVTLRSVDVQIYALRKKLKDSVEIVIDCAQHEI